jgi:hypothetical protein
MYCRKVIQMRRCILVTFVCVFACCGKENTVAPTSRDTPPTTATPPPTSFTVTGTVMDPFRGPVLGAVVAVVDPAPNPNAQKTATTNFAGRYTISGLAFSGFSLSANAPGFIGSSRGVSLTTETATTTADFVLSPLPGISFDGLKTDGSAFRTYTEGRFTVSSTVGDWMVKTTYGRPAPFIEFFSPSGPATSAEVQVTANGSTFRFSSVDLYSSITSIPFEISGFRSGTLAFRLSGTQGNTFGNFATISNHDPDAPIDTLFVRLSNPAACCPNPVGLDNIRVSLQ